MLIEIICFVIGFIIGTFSCEVYMLNQGHFEEEIDLVWGKKKK